MSHGLRRIVWTAAPTLVALLLTGCAEGDPAGPDLLATVDAAPANVVSSTSVEFDIGVLSFLFAEWKLWAPDGRVHWRHLPAFGPVSGDITGDFEMSLHANLTGVGSGHIFGPVVIETSEGVWTGRINGEFETFSAFVDLVLTGPDQQTLRAFCTEIDPSSDILECSGELRAPHG